MSEQRVPVYFADVESFAAYYGLDLGAARGRIHRLVVLGWLEPVEAPDWGWRVMGPLPQERRGYP
jgi:hypothetical protein